MNKISIVAPVYKIKETYLRQSISSMINQTLREIEIILVDDGSPDLCGNICDEYALLDSRIKVIHQDNQGVSVARNTGIAAVTGEYTCFVDPDDWIESDMCDKAYKQAKKMDCDILFFSFVDEYENKSIIPKKRKSSRLTDDDVKKMQIDVIYMTKKRLEDRSLNASAPWGKIYRTDFLRANQLMFKPGVLKGQDTLFNIYVYECKPKCAFDDFVGYHYRQWTNSISNRYNPNITEIMYNLTQHMYSFIQSTHENDDQYKNALYCGVLRRFGDCTKLFFAHRQNSLPLHKKVVALESYLEQPIIHLSLQNVSITQLGGIKFKISIWMLKQKWILIYLLLHIYLRKIDTVLRGKHKY